MDANGLRYERGYGSDQYGTSLLNAGNPPLYEKEVYVAPAAVQDDRMRGSTDRHGGFARLTIGLHVLTGIYAAFLAAAIGLFVAKYYQVRQIATYFQGREWWARDNTYGYVLCAICLIGPLYYLLVSLLPRTTSLRWGLRWGYFAYVLVVGLLGAPLLYLMLLFGNSMSHSEQQPSYWNYPATTNPTDSRCDFSIRYKCSGSWSLCDNPPYEPYDSNCPVCDNATQEQISTFTKTCSTVVSRARGGTVLLVIYAAHILLSFVVVLYTGVLQCFTCA